MRITEDRYSEHLRSLNLACRMIKLEARTRTISVWTRLSGHRIRALFKSYLVVPHHRVVRHRGMSPYKLGKFLRSPKLRCDAAMFGGICQSLGVLPEQSQDTAGLVPSVERGELLCDAYEWFRCEVPDTRLSFEQALLLLHELARGKLVHLGTCRVCRGVVLRDHLSTHRVRCVFCSGGDARSEGKDLSVVHANPELGVSSHEPPLESPGTGLRGR
jgi:hypothetical protein